MKRVLVIVSFIFSTAAFCGDWGGAGGYTKWGMTPDQVVAASNGSVERLTDGAAHQLSDRNQNCKLFQGLTLQIKQPIATWYVAVNFCFSQFTDQLNRVIVSDAQPDETFCQVMYQQQLHQFGTALAIASDDSRKWQWKDKQGATTITFVEDPSVKGSCKVIYDSLVTR
jgi:hypothetical protein